MAHVDPMVELTHSHHHPTAQPTADVIPLMVAEIQRIQQNVDHLARFPIQHTLKPPVAPPQQQQQPTVDVFPQMLAKIQQIRRNLDCLACLIPIQRIVELPVALPQQQLVPSPVQSNAEVETFVSSAPQRNTIAPLLIKFLELEPPTFHGEFEDDPYEFIDDLEMCFDVLHCTDTEKIEVAAFRLKGHARNWWRGYDRNRVCSWEEFKRALIMTVPESVVNKRVDEFYEFHQEPSMTVTEYKGRFYKLGRYVSEECMTESSRAYFHVMLDILLPLTSKPFVKLLTPPELWKNLTFKNLEPVIGRGLGMRVSSLETSRATSQTCKSNQCPPLSDRRTKSE